MTLSNFSMPHHLLSQVAGQLSPIWPSYLEYRGQGLGAREPQKGIISLVLHLLAVPIESKSGLSGYLRRIEISSGGLGYMDTTAHCPTVPACLPVNKETPRSLGKLPLIRSTLIDREEHPCHQTLSNRLSPTLYLLS
jgi:hypothetical protein